LQIVFIQTGGTIDKDYPRSSGGWAFEFGEPATIRLLEKLNPNFNYEILTAFQKDSLEVTDADRHLLATTINKHTANKFIITHGTDTILETAAFLAQKCPGKCLVITGAMRPERFSNSDAPINWGMAIATAQLIDQGCYVCMHGSVKSYQDMHRNSENGQFY
jgi:L-asparaginase